MRAGTCCETLPIKSLEELLLLCYTITQDVRAWICSDNNFRGPFAVLHKAMLRKIIGGGFERRRNRESDYNFLITNDVVLWICKTEDVILHVEKHVVVRQHCEILLFNNIKNCKRGRSIKTLKHYVLENNNTPADEFYWGSLREYTDMVGNRRNRSMSTTAQINTSSLKVPKFWK